MLFNKNKNENLYIDHEGNRCYRWPDYDFDKYYRAFDKHNIKFYDPDIYYKAVKENKSISFEDLEYFIVCNERIPNYYEAYKTEALETVEKWNNNTKKILRYLLLNSDIEHNDPDLKEWSSETMQFPFISASKYNDKKEMRYFENKEEWFNYIYYICIRFLPFEDINEYRLDYIRDFASWYGFVFVPLITFYCDYYNKDVIKDREEIQKHIENIYRTIPLEHWIKLIDFYFEKSFIKTDVQKKENDILKKSFENQQTFKRAFLMRIHYFINCAYRRILYGNFYNDEYYLKDDKNRCQSVIDDCAIDTNLFKNKGLQNDFEIVLAKCKKVLNTPGEMTIKHIYNYMETAEQKYGLVVNNPDKLHYYTSKLKLEDIVLGLPKLHENIEGNPDAVYLDGEYINEIADFETGVYLKTE